VDEIKMLLTALLLSIGEVKRQKNRFSIKARKLSPKIIFKNRYNLLILFLCAFIFILIGLVPSVFAVTDDFEKHPGGDLSIAGDTNSIQWTTTIFNDRADCRAEVVQYNEPNQHWGYVKAGMPSGENIADPGCTAKMKNSNVFEPFTSALSFKSYIYMYGDGGGTPSPPYYPGLATIDVKFYDTDGILQNTLTRTCYYSFRAVPPCTSAPSIKKYEYKVKSGTLYEIVDGVSSSLGAFRGTGYIGYVEFQATNKRAGWNGVANAYIYIDDFSTYIEQPITVSKTPVPTLSESTTQLQTSTRTPTPNTTTSLTQTPISTPSPIPSKSEINWTLIGGALLAIILIGVVSMRMQKPKESKTKAIEKMIPVEKPSQKDINITSVFGYKGAMILYKIKVENTIAAPIADVRVSLFVPNVFILIEKEKSLALLKPGESKTVTFEIRPTGECGDCEVSGKVTYYDTGSNRTKETEIGGKMLSIVCPMLKVKEITETEWHNIVSNLIETEESTKEIDMPAETLFVIVSRIIKDMNMHMLKPETTQSQQFFNGVARFFGEGVKGLRYAAQVEVVGGAKKSKLILKAWAEKEDALTGFYHGILDQIEKRINVKGYIDDSFVQYNVQIGDRIGTQIKDSVIQRSTIGAGARKCPDCGREVEANEKFCMDCGAKIGG